jgi:hypothetical protein
LGVGAAPPPPAASKWKFSQTGVRAQPPRPILPLLRLKVSLTSRIVPAACFALSGGEANGSSRMYFSVPERVASIR